MRQLTKNNDKAYLNKFADFLYSKGIETELESEGTGSWELWVLDDDHIEEASESLKQYEADPNHPDFKVGIQKGRQKFDEDKAEAKKTKAKVIDARTTFNTAQDSSIPFISTGLLVLGLGIFGLGVFDPEVNDQIYRGLAISNFPINAGFLPEVFRGEIWRIITPAFIHDSFMHVFFNMYWVAIFGPRVEKLIGLWWFLTLFLISSIIPNLGQYIIVGPNFLGMSGVVYALIGFAYMTQRLQLNIYLGLDSALWMFAMIWLAIGFTGLLPIANVAHVGGLLMGLGFAWAYNAIGGFRLNQT